MTLISVVMHCPSIADEYGDTANLLDYAFENFNLYNIDNANTNIDNDVDFFAKYQSFFNTSNSPLKVKENGKIILPNSLSVDDAEKYIDLLPIESLSDGDNLIGSIIYSYNDVNLGNTDIVFNNTDSLSLSSNLYIDPDSLVAESVSETTDNKLEKITKAGVSSLTLIIAIITVLIVLVSGVTLIYYLRSKKRNRRTRRRNNRFY